MARLPLGLVLSCSAGVLVMGLEMGQTLGAYGVGFLQAAWALARLKVGVGLWAAAASLGHMPSKLVPMPSMPASL